MRSLRARRAVRIALSLLAASTWLPATAARAADSSCLANGCHQAFAKLPRQHAPASGGDCQVCHKTAEEFSDRAACKSGKTFKLDEQPKLCFDCHTAFEGISTHAAMEQGCTSCHDPHGSKNRALLKESSLLKLCTACHSGFDTGTSIHLPVKQGNCTACHSPHATPNKPLLLKPRNQICRDCHKLPEPDSPEAVNWSHYPVRSGDCAACHRPHTSSNQHLLAVDKNEICLRCHDASAAIKEASVKRIDLRKKFKHSAVVKGGCSDCHRPHGSPNPALLAAESVPKLCSKCHAEFFGAFKHSAVLLGRCGRCHEPHASDLPKLARAKGSALCFECHADDVTGRVSVHAPIVQGGCLECHGPHDGSNRALVKIGTGKDVCLSCHAKGGRSSKLIDLERPVVHEAIPRFGCKGCHDAHGSNEPTLLLAKGNALCTACHAKQADGSHIMTGITGKPHPVAVVADPTRPGKPMACVSCHDPHASTSPKLLVGSEVGMSMCDRCHGKGQRTAPPARQPASPGPAKRSR